jgi:hypothetical protein
MKTPMPERKPAGKIGAVSLTAVLLFAALVISHEGETKTENMPGNDSLVTTTPQRDSVYAVINENYQSVRRFFEYSCFDCHSTMTNYPWYYKIPGIKGMVDEDIKEGLEHFDLTEDFPFKSKHSQADILEDIREEIEEGEMPLMSYRLMHWGRMIEGPKRDSVFKWIDTSLEMLKSLESED